MNAIWQYFRSDQTEILHWVWTTIWLAGASLIAGLIIALPIGWLANRVRWTYPPLVTLAGVIYTIPSLILFLSLPALVGTKILDPINVAIALTAYTVALLVRVVADGLGAVDSYTMDAATAMGYTRRQRLFGVQFPIAVPVIGAGLRVAAVSNVSLISVASIIGVPQLGQLFVAGNNNNSLTPIWLGLILIMAIAFLFDGVILLGIRVLTPWRRAVKSA